MEGLAPQPPNLGRIIAVFNWVQYSFCRGTILSIGVNLRGIGRLKPQLHETLPAYAGFKTLIYHQSAQADLVFVAATSSRQGLS
jgi:hypothetical protein